MSEIERPRIVLWAKLYLVVLGLVYLACMLVSPFFLLSGSTEGLVLGVLLLVSGFLLFAASIVPLFLPPRPWVWLYVLVLIGLGMTSGCFLPFCIALLVFWVKPDVKRYYGKIVE